jgi:hypothetical protein
MDLKDSNKFLAYLLLFSALILIALGDFMSFTIHNLLVSNLLIWLGIFVAILGIFALIG